MACCGARRCRSQSSRCGIRPWMPLTLNVATFMPFLIMQGAPLAAASSPFSGVRPSGARCGTEPALSRSGARARWAGRSRCANLQVRSPAAPSSTRMTIERDHPGVASAPEHLNGDYALESLARYASSLMRRSTSERQPLRSDRGPYLASTSLSACAPNWLFVQAGKRGIRARGASSPGWEPARDAREGSTCSASISAISWAGSCASKRHCLSVRRRTRGVPYRGRTGASLPRIF